MYNKIVANNLKLLRKNILIIRNLSQNTIHSQSVPTSDQPISRDKEWDTALPFESIPGPSKFDMLREFLLPGGEYRGLDMPQMSEKLYQDYGEITKISDSFGRTGFVFVHNPEDFEKVFRNEGIWPIRVGNETLRYYRDHANQEVFKDYGGLVTDQGDRWANLRAIANPVMMQPKTVRLYIPFIDEIAKEFVEKIRNERDEKLEVDKNFSLDMCHWALESIAYIALDTRINILNDKNHSSDGHKLVRAVRDFFDLSFELEVKPSLWRYISTPAFKKQMAALDTMTNIAGKYILKSIEQIKENNKNSVKSEHEMGVLEKLLKVDEKAAFIMATDMLSAGVDTTSSVSINLMYMLAKNPDKQKRLREEVMRILPEKDSILTAESLNNIPYMRACLKEVNRMRPIITANVRAAGRDLVIRGYRIPKGKHIVMQFAMVYAKNDVFPNSHQFIPERWLKEGNDTGCPSSKTAHPFAFMPFGFGPRMCIGRRFAELEIYSLIARIIRNFEIEWHYPDMKQKAMIILVPDGDLKFRFIEI